MDELNYIAGQMSAAQAKISADVMNIFAQHYNQEKEEWFSNAHGLSNASEYDRSSYKRVAFSRQSDVNRFVQDMQSQGVDVVATPFKLYGQYIAEISASQEDGRQAAEVIEDFKMRYDITPEEERRQEYEPQPLHSGIGDGLADVLLVNHLDTLGTAIHKYQEISTMLGSGQYGQTSNQDIFRSHLDEMGEANPQLRSGKAKVATVLNNDIVIMDGKIVSDEAVRENVLSQHHERMEFAENKISGADSKITNRHLNNVTAYINQQADLLDEYQRLLDRNETLSASQMQKYEDAKSLISGFEQDYGRTIDSEHHISKSELIDFNDKTLNKAREAGFDASFKIGGSFDAITWKALDSAALESIGISSSTQALLYSLNSSERHLSLIEKNSEAIRESMYRQDYAVTTSKGDLYTVKEEPSVFAAWTLGSLNDITNRFNTQQITKDLIVQNKLAALDDSEQQMILSALGMESACESAVSEMPELLQKQMEKQLNSGAFTSYSDLLDEKKAGLLVVEYGNEAREQLINDLISSNSDISQLLKEHGITRVSLKHISEETTQRLEVLIHNATGSPAEASLTAIKNGLEKLKQHDIELHNDLLQRIQNNLAESSFSHKDLLDMSSEKREKVLTYGLALSKLDIERGILDKGALDDVKKIIGAKSSAFKSHNASVNSSEKMLTEAARMLAAKKKKEIFENNQAKLKALTAEGMDLRKMSDEQIQTSLQSIIDRKNNQSSSITKTKSIRARVEASEYEKLKQELMKYSEVAYKAALLEPTKEEKEGLQKINEVFSLTKADRIMLAGQAPLKKELEQIEWLKGKVLLSGAMTPEKLLEINAAFLKHAGTMGFSFITPSGSFDIKLLQSLSIEDLKKLGISVNVRNMLVDINRKGSFGKTSQFGNTAGMVGKGIGFFIRKVDGSDSWSDVSELISYSRKISKYTYDTVISIQRLSNIRLTDLANLRRRGGVQNLIQQYKKPLPKKNPKPKKAPVNAKPLSAQQIKRQEKYAERLKKRLSKTYSKQNTMLAKFSKQMAALKKKIAESALGKAFAAASTAITSFVTTALLIYFGIAAILALFVQICILVATLVIALVDMLSGIVNIGNWFAPSSYDDTVAWALYQDLLNQENQYVAELAHTPEKAYDERQNINYGYDGEDLQTYLAGIENLAYSAGDVHINPFHTEGYATDDTNVNYHTVISKYDGIHTYDITTNLNDYSIIEVEDEDTATAISDITYGISNGHTSNIKDIIAMTDVMYQMEATDSDDESMTSVLGMSPAQLNVNGIGEYIGYGFKLIGEFFVNLWDTLFGEGSDWTYSTMETNGVTYATVQNYAFHLFELSHQQYLYLGVDYCDKDKVIYNADGTELDLSHDSLVEYGICPEPVNNDFKLRLYERKPEPYIIRESDGILKYLNTLNSDGTPFFDISVSVEDNLASGEDVKMCLWENMPLETGEYINGENVPYGTTNAEFWNKITSDSVQCWTQSSSISQDFSLSASASSGWYTSSSSALNKAKANVVTSLQFQYNTLASSGKLKETYYVITEDVATAYIYTYFPIDSTTVSYGSPDYDYDFDDGRTWVDCDINGDVKYCTLTTTTYRRNCKGHTFVYCGGHVSTHEQGNVFSVTNEQIALTEMLDEGNEPLALGTDYTNGGSSGGGNNPYSDSFYPGTGVVFPYNQNYPEIHGKVIHSEVNYKGAASEAAVTGGGLTPAEDIYQGTAVSKGLNIIIDPSGNWGKGTLISSDGFEYYKSDDSEGLYSGVEVDGNLVRYCRDIFDIDCIILKGCNIFPMTDFTKYEGWTADNMLLVCNRLTMDWYEAYGFDIATEIGEYNYKLSTQDIEMLQAGLAAEYGTSYDQDRQEIINALLAYIGRGHYTMHHHPFTYYTFYDSDQLENANHGYLSYLCTSSNYMEKMTDRGVERISFSGSCSAGNEIDVGNFAMNYLAKKYQRNTGGSYAEMEGLSSPSSLLPGDIVTHSKYDVDANGCKIDVTLTGSDINGELLKDFHLNNQAVVYVGAFSNTGIQAMKDYLKGTLTDDEYTEYIRDGLRLSTGQTIETGIPICIDLNQMGIYSGLRLRTSGSSENLESYLNNYFTGGAEADDKAKANSALSTTYYWLIHPDSRTKKFDVQNIIYPSW